MTTNPLRKRKEPFRGRRLPRRSSESNPEYAYGPTGFRPPKTWWNKMIVQARKSYRPRKGQSQESYKSDLSRIVGGIWSRFSDATRTKILHKYEPSAVSASNPKTGYLSCPSCNNPTRVNRAGVYLKCNLCNTSLVSVRVTKR